MERSLLKTTESVKTWLADVFVAAEESGRRKGNDLDEVDNLEYDAGEIDEEDDEEIDSDEAFDESDEDRFEGYKFYGSTKVELSTPIFFFYFVFTVFYSELSKERLEESR